jgi:Cu-processing system ATP-binding protein
MGESTMMDGGQPILAVDIEKVCKHYGDFDAVSNLSLQIPERQVIALIGHNGAGKTSLLKMILGVTKPSSGRIRLWGQSLQGDRSFNRDQIGFLPEVANFTDAMSGIEMLKFFARIKQQPLAQCAQLLERVGLSNAARGKIKTYSKGMRQRLGLAQALLGNPKLLILDEPTTGLDPDLRRDFYAIVYERQQQGATIIISTHSLAEIEIQADSIAILKKGRLLAQGSVSQLCERTGINTRVQLDVEASVADDLVAKLGERYPVSRIAEGKLEFSCQNGDKLKLLEDLFSSGVRLQDIRIQTPRLDDIYSYYMEGRHE